MFIRKITDKYLVFACEIRLSFILIVVRSTRSPSTVGMRTAYELRLKFTHKRL